MNIDDFAFTPENIELAAANSQKNDSSQADALEFLNKWSQTPSSIIDSLYLLQKSDKFITHFIASSLIKNVIASYWRQMEKNDRKEYRDSLYSIIMTSDKFESNILYNLIDALCSIALFEWPEDYQNFLESIFIKSDESTMKKSLKIISCFFEKVDHSKNITELRRNNLRQFIISDYQEQIYSIVTNNLTINDFSNDILSIFNCMIRWNSIEEAIDFEIFQQLILQLLPNENTCENTVKCLKSIFLQRTDSLKAFNAFSPFLIDSLARSTFQNQKPVTSNPSVIMFLVKFLDEYSWILEIALIYDQITSQEQKDENVEPVVKTMQENKFSSSLLHDDLLYLYQVVLSIPTEEIVEELKTSFWNLWQKNLRNILNEQKCECQTILSSSKFFLPFLNEITKTLFNSLVSFDDDKEENFYQMEAILTSIYSINSDEYINFLKEQPPSPQLCFAIAAFEFNKDDSKLESIVLIIVELFQSINENPDFQSAFLFGLSHCSKFFNENKHLFSQFIEFMLSAMTGNEEAVSKASTRAFKYIVKYHSELFKKDAQMLIETIINQSEDFLLNMETESSKRVFKSCIILIENNFKDDLQILNKKLFEPVINVLNNPDQFPQETVEKSLYILSKCFRNLDLSNSDLFDYFWSPLFQIASNIIPEIQFPDTIVELILRAIGYLQLNIEYEKISSQIDEIFNMMKSRGKIEDCFFTYFEIVRTTHQEMDSMYKVLQQELVVPYLISEESASEELFKMIGKFSPDSIEIEWLIEIVFESVKHLDKNVGSAALEVFQSMISEFSEEQRISFLTSIAPDLIESLIEIITDLIHKPLLRLLVNTLRSILSLIDYKKFSDEKIKNLPSSFVKIIVNSLSQVATEPQSGFFESFANYLFSIMNSRFDFIEAFANLLIIMKKASPCDAELFRIESQKTEI